MDEPEFVESATGGRKQKKPDRWDLLPWDALEELAVLYGNGAEKYAERNWELGLDFNWSYRALINHAQTWWMGEDDDPEMKVSHLACVAFHALGMLALYRRHGEEFDNRPKHLEHPEDETFWVFARPGKDDKFLTCPACGGNTIVRGAESGNGHTFLRCATCGIKGDF